MSFTPDSSSLGVTFSPSQARQLGLDPLTAFAEILTWPINVIRLGTYWNEIEKTPGKYDFSQLAVYLNLAQKAQKEIVLTLGVKAPRWPEYYFTSHLNQNLQDSETQKQLLAFVEVTVIHTKPFSCIKTWQVENEPLDPSGPNRQRIPFSLLEQECNLIRSLDSRPLLITFWGNDLLNKEVKKAQELADIIGLDLYYKQFVTTILGKNIYRGPLNSDKQLEKLINSWEKPVWITELQAEPWEKNEEIYRSSEPESFSLDQLQKNWKRLQTLPVDKVLFWGVEYWLWREKSNEGHYSTWLKDLLFST